MNKNKVVVQKKKGFSFLSFFLGILFGIILLIGGVVGGVAAALNVPLDTLFSTFKIDNGPDENGRNTIVNTSEEDGVKTALDLINKISAMAQDPNSLTLRQIDNLLPATAGIVDKIRASLDEYIQLDYDAIYELTLPEFGPYFQDVIYDIQPGTLIDKFGGDGNNMLVNLLLNGVEADYIVDNGQNVPLYYDTFLYSEGGYVRTGDSQPLPQQLAQYVMEERGGYRVYFYQSAPATGARAVEDWYVAAKSEDGLYTAAGEGYQLYSESTARPSGNYYLDAQGQKVALDPITLRSFMKEDSTAFDNISITALLNTEENGMIEEVLGDITVGDLLNGTANFDDKINNLELSILLEAEPDDNMMLFFVYGLTDMVPAGENTYTATYKLGEGDPIPVTVTVEEGKIKSIVDADGQKLKGTTVSNINSLIDNIDISIFIDVTVENKIIVYLAYGITELTEGEEGSWTAKLGEHNCAVTVDEAGKITSVVDQTTGQKITAAGIDELSDRVNGVTANLKIKDVVDVGDDPLLIKLGEYTINNIGDALDELVIGDVLDIPVDNKILAYLGYGVTGLQYEEGAPTATAVVTVNDKQYNCVLTVQDGLITGGYYIDTDNGDEQVPLEGTTLNGASDRVNELTTNVPIRDLIELGEDNALLEKLGDYTLGNIGQAINDLEVADVLDISPDAPIMTYLAFGITEVTNTDGVYTAVKDDSTVYFKVREKEDNVYLDSMYNNSEFTGERLAGTKVADAGTQLDNMMDEVPLKYLIDVGDNRLLQKIAEKPINQVSAVIDELTIPDAIDVDPNSAIMVYLAYGITEVDVENLTAKQGEATVYITIEQDESGNKIITGVYKDAAHEQAVEATKINEVGDKINGLTNEVKIKDLIDIDPNDKLMSKIGEYTISEVGSVVNVLEIPDVVDIEAENAVMAYLGYGLTEVTVGEVGEDGQTAKGTAKYRSDNGAEQEPQDVYIELAKKEGSDAWYIVGVYSAEEFTEENRLPGTIVGNVSTRISGITADLTIGDLMEIDENDKLLQKLAGYPINQISTAIDELELGDVIDIQPTAIMAYLGYGVTDFKYAEGEPTATAVITIDGKKYNCVFNVDVENNVILNGYYIDTANDSAQVPLAGTKINEAGGKIDGALHELKVGDIITDIDDDNTFFMAIKNSPISSIDTAISRITINQLYAANIYADATLKQAVQSQAGEGQIEFSEVYVYYTLGEDGAYTPVQADENAAYGKLTAEQFAAGVATGNTYYTYGRAGALWKLMLESTQNGVATEQVYTINDLPQMITNVTNNINKATLNDLKQAGIISLEENQLNTTIITPSGSKKLGDMTLEETLNYIVTLGSHLG